MFSTGATTSSINVFSSGNYFVTVVGSNGCAGSSAPVAVTVLPAPVPELMADGSKTICEGGSVTLTSAAASEYMWSTGDTTQSIIVSSAGSYFIDVTYANGCSATSEVATVIVTSNPATTISADGPLTICEGDSVVLTSSEANAYMWSTGDTTRSITVTTAGTFSVTGTYSGGCSSNSSPVTVIVNTSPAPMITASGDTDICPGDSVMLTATAGTSYMWSNGDSIQSITVTMAGDYYVTVSAGNGCTGMSDTVTVNVAAPPTPTIVASGPLTFCKGDSVTLTVTGPGMYQWNTGSTAQSITVRVSGTYVVTVRDTFGCSSATASATVKVIVPAVAIITASGPTTFCVGDSVMLTASNGASFLWSNGETGKTIPVFTAGMYSVIISDINGCKDTSNPITVAIPVDIDLGIDTVVCGDCITLVAGAPWLTYSWSTGSDYPAIRVCFSDTITVTAWAGMCMDRDTIIIDINPMPEVDLGADTTLAAPGTVTLDAGNAGTTFMWSTGETTQTIVVDSSGSYFVDVSNILGCIGTDTIVVTIPTSIDEHAGGVSNMKIFPNPNSGEFNLSFDLRNTEDVQVRIVNYLGEIIYTESLDDFSGLYEKQIQMPAVATGVYFVQVTAGSKVRTIKVSKI